MRKLLVAAALSLVVTQAGAGDRTEHAPEFRAYASFDLGSSKQQSLGLHYGLRMDQDSREASAFGTHRPAVVKVDFSKANGFEGTSLYGMPLSLQTYQKMNMLSPNTATTILWISGIIVAGGGAYAIYELSKSNDSEPDECQVTKSSKLVQACPAQPVN